MTPQVYAATLLRHHPGGEALKIAEDNFKATRDTTPEWLSVKVQRTLPEHREAGREVRKTAAFWDQVFGIVLKSVDGSKRKEYLKKL